MTYKVLYLAEVEKDLRKLNKSIVSKLLDRIEKYLAQDPKNLGKPLKGMFKGYWRYRWGDYRVVYKISDSEILITILRISHRKSVYG